MHVALAAEIGLPLLLHLSPGSAARAAELGSAGKEQQKLRAALASLGLGDQAAAA